MSLSFFHVASCTTARCPSAAAPAIVRLQGNMTAKRAADELGNERINADRRWGRWRSGRASCHPEPQAKGLGSLGNELLPATSPDPSVASLPQGDSTAVAVSALIRPFPR